MLVQQVDAVGLQPLQGGVHDLPDVFRPAVQPYLLPALDLEAELGGDHHPVADGGEGLADQFLVRERTVHLGGVEERDPEIDGGADEPDPGLPVHSRAVAGTQAHAAQPQCRHFQVARTEFTRLHHAPPRKSMGQPHRTGSGAFHRPPSAVEAELAAVEDDVPTISAG